MLALLATWQQCQDAGTGWTEERRVSELAYLKARQSNVPLRAIDWAKLTAYVALLRSRPISTHKAPLAVATVQGYPKAALAFFDWCDTSGRWEAPRRFERIFRINYRALKTPLEQQREGEGVDVFTVDELARLWRAASPRQRLYMGLALNTGETAQGLASLCLGNLTEQAGAMVVRRHRGKTGVLGVYPLWPEVAELVRAHREQGGEDASAFRSMDGQPLVRFGTVSRVDSISKTWANLITKAGVRRLGFSVLRKTGASLVADLTGSLEVAQCYLSHKGQSVAERHYLARRFDRLGLALGQLHQALHGLWHEQQQAAA